MTVWGGDPQKTDSLTRHDVQIETRLKHQNHQVSEVEEMGTLHEPDKWDPPKTSPNPTPSQIFSHTQSDIDYEGLQKSLSQPIVSKPQLKKKEQQNPHRRLQKIKKRSTQQKRRLRQQDSRGTLVDLIAIAGLVINLLMAFGGYLGRIVRYVIAKGVLNNVVTISPKDLNHPRLRDHEHHEDSNHSSQRISAVSP